MRAKSLFIICATPFASALAACHYLGDNALTSAIEQAALSDQYPTSIGQQPIYVRPHRPHPPPKKEEANGTIYEVLAGNPGFSNITRALKFVEEVGSYLNDSSINVTFFAPPDDALHRRRKHNHGQKVDWSSIDALTLDQFTSETLDITAFGDLAQVLELLDEVDVADSDDKEKRKKILKLILRGLLNYHIIPTDAYSAVRLGLNTTFPTKLKIAHAFDGQPLRLRTGHIPIPPITTINFITKIVRPDVPATNGLIQVVNHPLFPPLPVFQGLYLIPQHFSIFTSVLQRSSLTDALDLRFTKEHGLSGASLVTVFAPTNRAFEVLPFKLRLFLFSPFGARVLAKLLQYHIVPDAAVFSDYIHHKHVHKTPDSIVAEEFYTETPIKSLLPWFLRFNFISARSCEKHHPTPISHFNITLETLFTNHTIDAVFDKTKITIPIPGQWKPYKIETKVFANHHLALIPDVIALNGAIHVIDRLLDPRKHAGPPDDDHHHHHHHHHKHHHKHDVESLDSQPYNSWDDWEDWLPQWGEE